MSQAGPPGPGGDRGGAGAGAATATSGQPALVAAPSRPHPPEMASRRFAWLAPLLLGLPLASPLAHWAQVACTHDGNLHYYRVAAMRFAWQHGLPFTRWLPDLAFGYGYPFFIYREPLPLYLTLLPHLLGLPLPAAINLFYALCLLGAGLFTFLWVRDLFGPAAGTVSAVAYMAAPYQLIDALVRGNQPESLALALFPLLLWSGRRFLLRGNAGSFLPAVTALVALGLGHNISLLTFTPLYFLYLLLVGWMARLRWGQVAVRLALLFGLGLGATLFYTGTALLELDQVTISHSVSARNNDFHFNFASLAEIFAPPAPSDPALLNPPLLLRLGWVPSALALLGLLRWRSLPPGEQRGHLWLMLGAVAFLLFMALPASLPLWEGLPLIPFVQFPWRFVGRAALPLALLAGLPFAVLSSSAPDRRPALPRAALPLLALAALLLEALPALYPRSCSQEPFPSIASVHRYERETGLVGVDPLGSYFPRTVQQRPAASPLEEAYAAGNPPQRFDRNVLPEGARFTTLAYAGNRGEAHVSSPEPFTARYLTFAFPGWQATVDGQAVPITPSAPQGLITFAVPAGEHNLAVRWGSTPRRTLLNMASLLALAGILVTAILLRPAGVSSPPPPQAMPAAALLPLALLALAFLALRLAPASGLATPWRRVAPPPVAYPQALEAGGLRLAGYNLSQEQVASGGLLTVDLAWQTTSPPTARTQSNLWLTGPDGLVWSDRETSRPRPYEETEDTRFWQPGQWAWDSREVAILPGTPPGDYALTLTLFDLDTLQPLTLRDGQGAVVGPEGRLGTVRVTRPERPVALLPAFSRQESVAGLAFLGYEQDRSEAAPGDPLLLTLAWQGSGQPGPEQVELRLVGQDGQPGQSWSIPPVRADFPPILWGEGERWRGQHALRLAARLASGTYHLELAGIPLGSLKVTAPERRFSPPPFAVPAGARFAGLASLAGYTLSPAENGDLALTLVWQGLAEMETSYRVFVHLVNGAGEVVGQADAEPAGWTRPTTGWAPGEYVEDRHTLSPGDKGGVALRVGLYDAGSGQRLLLEDGSDYLTLPLP